MVETVPRLVKIHNLIWYASSFSCRRRFVVNCNMSPLCTMTLATKNCNEIFLLLPILDNGNIPWNILHPHYVCTWKCRSSCSKCHINIEMPQRFTILSSTISVVRYISSSSGKSPKSSCWHMIEKQATVARVQKCFLTNYVEKKDSTRVVVCIKATAYTERNHGCDWLRPLT